MIDRLWSRLPVFGLALLSGAAEAAPRDPTGVWLTQDGRARVRVERCGARQDQICGYVVWLRGGEGAKAAVDRKNPDAGKAGRPVLGHQLMLGLKPNDDDQFEGRIYNAEDGQTYDVTVWVEARDLMVKGCLIGFLCSTQTWTRTADTAPGQLVAPTGTPGGPRPDPQWAVKADATPSPAGSRQNRTARP